VRLSRLKTAQPSTVVFFSSFGSPSVRFLTVMYRWQWRCGHLRSCSALADVALPLGPVFGVCLLFGCYVIALLVGVSLGLEPGIDGAGPSQHVQLGVAERPQAVGGHSGRPGDVRVDSRGSVRLAL
jgi:hypothetical protein